jgi:hypothetical protein
MNATPQIAAEITSSPSNNAVCAEKARIIHEMNRGVQRMIALDREQARALIYQRDVVRQGQIQRSIQSVERIQERWRDELLQHVSEHGC